MKLTGGLQIWQKFRNRRYQDHIMVKVDLRKKGRLWDIQQAFNWDLGFHIRRDLGP